MVMPLQQQGGDERVKMNVSADFDRKHPTVEDQAKLNATGLITGLAIAIHNFPEGLATFVAALAEPSLGAAIAVAIAIHNVPEGVCVAMPIYYSTGSRLRAFMWATLSGVSEPIGALFGWAVLGSDVSQVAYGSMFGIVAGMMVYISFAELLPSAYRFEPNPAVVTSAMVSGMVIMALSLIAFQV
jgi:ZIP family zinc transporter